MAVKTKTHPHVARARQDVGSYGPQQLRDDITADFKKAVAAYQAQAKALGVDGSSAGYDVANTIIDAGNSLRDQNKPASMSDSEMPELGDFDDEDGDGY